MTECRREPELKIKWPDGLIARARTDPAARLDIISRRRRTTAPARLDYLGVDTVVAVCRIPCVMCGIS